MISGIETAGLVLAILPLLISALEHYHKGLEPLATFVRYRVEIKTLKTFLGFHRGKFLASLERLLGRFVRSKELGLLLSDPLGPRWKDNNLEARLAEHLGHFSKVFEDVVGDIKATLEDLRGRLDIDKDGNPNWVDRNAFKRAFERFRFSFIDRGKIEILKKQLKDGNSYLSNMTKSSNELAPLRQRNRIQYEEVDRYREHIAALSAALTEADWGCNCLIPHIANLRSGEPISGASGSSSCCGQEDCRGTNVLFSFHDVVDQPRWNWHEVHFEPITAIVTTPPTSQDHLTQSHDQSHPKPPTGQSVARNKLKKRRVHFEADKAPNQVVASSSSSTTPQNKLEKLCASLMSVREGGPPLGYIPTASTAQLVLYPVQRHPRPLKGTAGNMVSLEDMLSDMTATRLQKDTAVRTRRAYMKMDERLYLAYVSSWVFLKVYATPWLGSIWSSRTIRFLQRLDHTKRPLTCEPFVSKPFWASLKEGAGEQADLGTMTTTPGSEDSLGSSTTSSSTHSSENPTVRHRNYGVFMLGVSLLELLFNKKITDLYTKTDLGKDGINEYTMVTAATRLVEKAYEEAGERFGSAVRRCIFCEFDQRYNDVKLPEFRKAFYDGVVAPLEEHWRVFSGGHEPS